MHTEADTATVARTLALYGVRKRSRAYLVTRGIVRASWLIAFVAFVLTVAFTN